MRKYVAQMVKFIALVYKCGSRLTWTLVWDNIVYLCVWMSVCVHVFVYLFFLFYNILRVNIKDNIAMSFLFAGSL